jgi:hypothetical protein
MPIITICSWTGAQTAGPEFPVELGRFDSKVSGGTNNVDLPSADSQVVDVLKFFRTLGLDDKDLVTLYGKQFSR